MINPLFPRLLVASLLAWCATASAGPGMPNDIAPTAHVADGFEFVPLSPSIRDIRTRFDATGGNIAEFALVGPTVMAFPPDTDGHVFVATQRGRVFHITYERDAKDRPVVTGMTQMLDIRDKVSAAIDRGLIGMAVHPDFRNGKGRLYLSYTHANGDLDGYYESTCHDEALGAHPCTLVKEKTAGLAWYEVDNYIADPLSEHLILGKVRGTAEKPSCSDYSPQADCIYSDSGSHTVGGVAFDPKTRAVCLATGDGAGFYKADPLAIRAADLDNLSGKILCVDPDTGLGLPSNPYWTGNPADKASRVVVYGLRNPYRFMFNEARELIIYMVGWNQIESIYRAYPDKGGYAGWPCHGVETPVTDYQYLSECKVEPPEAVLEPVYDYIHPPENDYQAAVVGAARFGSIYPEWLAGRYAVGDYRNDWVKVMTLDEASERMQEDFELAHGTDPQNPIELGAPVMFHNDNQGRVMMLSFMSGVVDGFNIGTIHEIVYEDTSGVEEPPDEPEVADPETTSARISYEPLTTSYLYAFDCSESSINGKVIDIGDSILCRWDFEDGSPRIESNGLMTHRFPGPGNYRVGLTLIDASGLIIAHAERDVRVADPLQLAQPVALEFALPQRDVAISESFKANLKVLNSGAEEPFCALLDVIDTSTDNVVREVRRCTTLPTDATTTLQFPLFFSEPGTFGFEVKYVATESDVPAADFIAYLGRERFGDIDIINRSGVSDGQPEVSVNDPDHDASGGAPNDDIGAGNDDADPPSAQTGVDRGVFSGAGDTWLGMLLAASLLLRRRSRRP